MTESQQRSLQVAFVITEGEARTKQEVLTALAEQAADTEVLADFNVDDLYERLHQREELGSTGVGEGVAIPHCAIEGLDDFVVGVMINRQSVDFDAIDGEPVQVFFLIIGPAEQRNRHIKILSAISKMVKTPETVDKLRKEQDEEKVKKFLQQHLVIREEKPSGEGYCLLNTYIQEEDVFNDILELLSAEEDASLSVVETKSAGDYLNRLPLFSSYWTEGGAGFNRLIMTVVPKSRCNDLIRQISLIADTESDEPGLLITAQELMYAAGSISF
ncbi:MAG: PTS sugar transporter subunit IIA [Verrucomicrobiota bacterium]